MGRLRDRMAVDLRLRGMSPVTQRMYLGCVERFVVYHHRRSPKALGEAEIRAFLDHLVVERQLSRSTQRVHVAAIRFLYEVTLDRPFTVQRIPFPRRDGERLPVILSVAEVERLLSVQPAESPCDLMTLYGAGLRVSEVCALAPRRHRQPADVDPGARGEGRQGSVRHVEPAALGDVAGVLATAAAPGAVPVPEPAAGQAAVADGRVSRRAPGRASGGAAASGSVRTCCGTPSRRICSKRGRTSARSRCCSATARSARRPAT